MSRVERAPNVKLVKKTLKIEVPEDYDLDEQAIEWIEHIIERAANRGSGLEDAECAHWHQRGHDEQIAGAHRAEEYILKIAGEAFAKGSDERARLIREVALCLAPLFREMEADRAKHKQLFLDSYQEEVRKNRTKNVNAA